MATDGEVQRITELTIDEATKDRMVEPGRICMIIWGKKDYRKLVCIVDFIDATQVLVDGGNGSLSNFGRKSLGMRRLQVTEFRIPLEPGSSSKQVAKAVKEFEVLKHWAQSKMGRRNKAILRKQELDDFGRFKLFVIKMEFHRQVASELYKLRAAASGKTVQQLRDREMARKSVHSTVARTNGRFRRVLAATRRTKDARAKKRLTRMHYRIKAIRKNKRKKLGFKPVASKYL